MNSIVNLKPGIVQKLPATRRGIEIRCLEGMLWITQEGDQADHLIQKGERFVVDRKGKVVLQGLKMPSTFSLN